MPTNGQIICMKRFFISLAAAFAAVMWAADLHAGPTDTINGGKLNEIVVTGARSQTDVRHLPMTVTIVGRETLTEQHQQNVLPTVMQQVPGLFVTSRGMMGYGVSGGAAGGINLRGISGGAGQLLLLIDGHPQYQGVYGHPISDSYQTLMAERVEVLRGPASVLYGSNAMGGVMNIVTRSMKTDGVKTSIDLGAGSYGTIQAEASNQVRSGKFHSTVSAQYGRSDNHRKRMGFEQFGGYVKLGYDINENWNAYVDADVTHFNASQPGSTTSPLYDADQWITRGMVSAALENHFDNLSGALSVYTNFGRHKIDDGTADPTQPTQRYFRSKDALTGVSFYQSTQLFEGNRITMGVDFQHIYGKAYYTSKQTGAVMATPNKQSGKSYRNEIAGYLDFRQDITSWLTVDAGLRVDHHSISGTEWVPQGGIVIRPIQTGEVKLMASKGFRNPTMREMYLYPPSNTDLKPERMWNYEISWRHRMEYGLTYGANFFYLKGDNMIQTKPVNGKPRNVNTGEIENWGFEAEVKCPVATYFNVTCNTSYLHMKNKVVASPEQSTYVSIDYHQDKWFASLGLQRIQDLYTEVGANESKENFWLLNANVSYSLLKNLQLWARGDNLLAQKYEINLGYPMPRATFMAGVKLDF